MGLVSKPVSGSTAHTQWIVDLIGKCAEEVTDGDIMRLSRDGFIVWSQGDGNNEHAVSRRDIEVLGGWGSIRQYANDDLALRAGPTPEELGQRRSVQHRNTHRNVLERKLGDIEYVRSRVGGAIQDAFTSTPVTISKLSKPAIDWKKPSSREIVVHVSDTHFGQCIDSEEVPGGRYDWQTAARRMAFLANAVVNFKNNGREDASLRLVLNGDLIEGKIHDDDRGVDFMTAQIDGARQIITAMIDFFRHHFTRIDVMGQSGNHERWPFRGPNRPTAQKYDSATTDMLRGIEMIFRSAEDVRFHIPKTPYSVWKSCGHTYFATHGDDVFKLGSNPSKSISFDKLPKALFDVESWIQANGDYKKVAVVMLGHYHNPLITSIPGLRPQALLTINGCAVGRTAYTQTIGIPLESPVQTFWEVTSDSRMESFTLCALDPADDDARFDKIIPTPTPIGREIPKVNGATTDFHTLVNSVAGSKRRK